MSREFKDSAYAHLAELAKGLASPARLELLDLLSQAPRTVEVLADEIGKSAANTSHHLQALKRAHLVRSQRDGVHVVYSIAGDDVRALLGLLHDVAAQHVAALRALTRDYFAARDGLEAVDRDTLLARVRAGEVVLLDVRPEHEFEAGHLPGALSIPVDSLESRLGELPTDRPIVAYCRGPYCAFSADAARTLRAQGFDARRSDVSVQAGALQ